MHPIRRQRLAIVLFIVVGVAVAVGLALVALQENVNLFYTPSQIATGKAPEGALIRAGGMVVENSVARDPESLRVSFQVTDYAHKVTIHYKGILPDLFREGQGIVAQGRLNSDGELAAVEVLAKHDEEYMPPEVQDALDQAGMGNEPRGSY